MKIPVAFLFFFALSFSGFGQTDTCVQHIRDAQTDYSNGLYDQSIAHIRIALKNCPLDKPDKIELYKLLILSDIQIDNLEDADKAAEGILRVDPNYKPNKLKDDPKLTAVFAKFKPVSSLAIGISGGVNQTVIDPEKAYSVTHDDNESNLGSYKARKGFHLGFFAQKRLIQNLWVKAGFEYRESGYKHSLHNILGSTVNYTEELKYYDLPVQVRYEFLRSDLRPFVFGGARFSFLNSAISTTTQLEKKDLVDRTSLRNSFTPGYFAGLGISYQVKAFQFFMQVDYCKVLRNVNRNGTRYDDPINLFKYYYVDDDFRMHHLSLSVGGMYNLIYRQKKVN